MALPEALELRYNESIHELEEQRTVAYITSAERIGIKKGFEQGIQRGMQQGMQRGIQQGIEQNRKEIAKKLLQQGLAVATTSQITELSTTELQAFLFEKDTSH